MKKRGGGGGDDYFNCINTTFKGNVLNSRKVRINISFFLKNKRIKNHKERESTIKDFDCCPQIFITMIGREDSFIFDIHSYACISIKTERERPLDCKLLYPKFYKNIFLFYTLKLCFKLSFATERVFMCFIIG